MFKQIKKAWKWLAAHKPRVIDAVAVVIIFASITFILAGSYKYDVSLSMDIAVDAPWLAKTGLDGSVYIVDSAKGRILKIRDNEIADIIAGGAPKGDTFWTAESMCADADGNVYVLETSWSSDGFIIDSESILKYDASGKCLGTIYYTEYADLDVICDKHHLFGIEAHDGLLYFVSADERGFALHTVDRATMEEAVVFEHGFENAITLIQDFVIEEISGTVYAIGKRGDIYVSDAESGVQLIYDLSLDTENNYKEAGKTVLYRGAVNEGGELFVTDIAGGRMLRFDKANGYAREHFIDGSQMWSVSYSDAAPARLTYVADEQVYIRDMASGDTTEYSVIKKSGAYLLGEVIFDFSILCLLLACVYALLRLSALLSSLHYTMMQKTGMMVIGSVIVVSVILVYGLIGQFQQRYRDELMVKLTIMSQIIGNGLVNVDVEELEAPSGFMGEEYQKLWNAMGLVLDTRYDYSRNFYCNILRYDGTEGYAVAYLDNSIGTYYPLTADETLAVAHIYETAENMQSSSATETGAYIFVMTPVVSPDGTVKCVVSIGSESYIIDGMVSNMVNSIAIAMVMIILVLMFLFGEGLSFASLRSQYKETLPKNKNAVPMHIVRVLIFITFMAFNMATSFLPIYIIKFVGEGLALPPALAQSLPITANLAFIAITSLVCPRIIGKTGFGKLAVISGLIALSGDVMMATAQNYFMIIIGLSLNGIGVGLITNSIHIFIATLSGDDTEGQGFSIFNAAILSGINCGMLFGSEIAETMGQSNVFYISSAAWLIVAVVFLAVGKRLVVKASETKERRRISQFIVSPGVLTFMILVQVPYIILNSFIYYFVPIFGAENGLSENIVSILIVLCSLCSVFLSMPLTKFVQTRYRGKAMYISGAIIFIGMLLFIWKMSVPALVTALLLIGIANSFGPAARASHFMGMKLVPRYGEARAMGIYDFVDNLGESSGSIIFATILTTGFRAGLLGFIAGTIGLNAVYVFSNRKSS